VHKCWTYQWAFVLFSDESSFLVPKPQVRRVWRQRGERYYSVNLRPSFKRGRKSVMVVALRVPAHAPWLARTSVVHRVTRMTCHAPVRTGGAVGAAWDLD